MEVARGLTLLCIGTKWRLRLPFYQTAPENVILYDFSIPTGLTDTTNIVFTSDGAQVPQSRLRYANFVNTLATRPAINIGFRANSNIGAIQA